MATSQKSAPVTQHRGPLDSAPRTAATVRVREVWDRRLRKSERELVLEIAGVRPVSGSAATELADMPWAELRPDQAQRILITLRDLAQLGNEAAYALGYSRRNG